MALPRLTFVLGGARSGKSAYAESLLANTALRTYIATAEAFDDEMRARINMHQNDRGANWTTVEAPLALAEAVAQLPNQPALLDCLTVWLGNLMHAERDLGQEGERLVEALVAAPGPLVVVSNEVGQGIVPENAMTRRFRDAAGQLNQRVAAVADRVVLVSAGLPLTLKGENRDENQGGHRV